MVLTTFENAYLAIREARTRQKKLIDDMEKVVKDANGLLIICGSANHRATDALADLNDDDGDFVPCVLVPSTTSPENLREVNARVDALLARWRDERSAMTRNQVVYDEQLSIIRTAMTQ